MVDILKRNLHEFVQVHPNVSFRYEFSKTRNRYIVSYKFEDTISDEDPLWDDIFELESSFDQYDDAPLFSEGNRLFTLSNSAEIVLFEPSYSEEKVELDDNEVYIVELSQSNSIYNGEITEDFLGENPTYSYAA